MGTIEFFIDHDTTAPMALHMNLPKKLLNFRTILKRRAREVNGVNPVFFGEEDCIYRLNEIC